MAVSLMLLLLLIVKFQLFLLFLPEDFILIVVELLTVNLLYIGYLLSLLLLILADHMLGSPHDFLFFPLFLNSWELELNVNS
jgi:hypothetical protein